MWLHTHMHTYAISWFWSTDSCFDTNDFLGSGSTLRELKAIFASAADGNGAVSTLRIKQYYSLMHIIPIHRGDYNVLKLVWHLSDHMCKWLAAHSKWTDIEKFIKILWLPRWPNTPRIDQPYQVFCGYQLITDRYNHPWSIWYILWE